MHKLSLMKKKTIKKKFLYYCIHLYTRNHKARFLSWLIINKTKILIRYCKNIISLNNYLKSLKIINIKKKYF